MLATYGSAELGNPLPGIGQILVTQTSSFNDEFFKQLTNSGSFYYEFLKQLINNSSFNDESHGVIIRSPIFDYEYTRLIPNSRLFNDEYNIKIILVSTFNDEAHGVITSSRILDHEFLIKRVINFNLIRENLISLSNSRTFVYELLQRIFQRETSTYDVSKLVAGLSQDAYEHLRAVPTNRIFNYSFSKQITKDIVSNNEHTIMVLSGSRAFYYAYFGSISQSKVFDYEFQSYLSKSRIFDYELGGFLISNNRTLNNESNIQLVIKLPKFTK